MAKSKEPDRIRKLMKYEIVQGIVAFLGVFLNIYLANSVVIMFIIGFNFTTILICCLFVIPTVYLNYNIGIILHYYAKKVLKSNDNKYKRCFIILLAEILFCLLLTIVSVTSCGNSISDICGNNMECSGSTRLMPMVALLSIIVLNIATFVGSMKKNTYFEKEMTKLEERKNLEKTDSSNVEFDNTGVKEPNDSAVALGDAVAKESNESVVADATHEPIKRNSAPRIWQYLLGIFSSIFTIYALSLFFHDGVETTLFMFLIFLSYPIIGLNCNIGCLISYCSRKIAQKSSAGEGCEFFLILLGNFLYQLTCVFLAFILGWDGSMWITSCIDSCSTDSIMKIFSVCVVVTIILNVTTVITSMTVSMGNKEQHNDR